MHMIKCTFSWFDFLFGFLLPTGLDTVGGQVPSTSTAYSSSTVQEEYFGCARTSEQPINPLTMTINTINREQPVEKWVLATNRRSLPLLTAGGIKGAREAVRVC